MTDDSTARPKLDLVILDCPDALALARFYAEVLGWGMEDGAGRDWATLVPPGGGIGPDNPDGRTTLAFQRIDDWVEPTWPGGAHPQQFHLDLAVADIDAAEPAVLAAGGRVHDHQPSKDGHFRVYLDPAGHPFCLIAG
jgi:predicted enzyme related to lactoylglutathione lyase